MLDGSKKRLVSSVGDGSIIKRFDKTPIPRSDNDVVCPHFLELKWATGCPYACAWCYLQGTFRFLEYKTKPRQKDRKKVEENIIALFDCRETKPEILNSGELSDSLMLERNDRPFSNFIMDLAMKQNKHRILFVTKSTEVDNLINIPNPQQAIVSFSLNAIKVADRWEKAPIVADRIEAASRLKNAGFEVRIRIDPIVPIDDWRKAYADLIKDIFNRFVPDRITIGSLRGLQSTINNSRDKSWVSYLGESSNWGKKIESNKRYEMYEHLVGKLREKYGYDKIALCKETVAMWDQLNMDFTKIQCNCTW